MGFAQYPNWCDVLVHAFEWLQVGDTVETQSGGFPVRCFQLKLKFSRILCQAGCVKDFRRFEKIGQVDVSPANESPW